METGNSQRLDQVAEVLVTQYRKSGEANLEEFCSQHPDLAPDLRRLYPTLVALEELNRLSTETCSPQGLPRHGGPETAPVELGDFAILREIGRGGMGIVYEAIQRSLDRRVALKVLPESATLQPQRLKRFEQEGRAAARLHHTNIVPVLGVGATHGLYYIAMQLIEGCALDDVLLRLRRKLGRDGPNSSHFNRCPSAGGADEENQDQAEQVARKLLDGATGTRGQILPAYWLRIARIGQQAADALQYASTQGVLHRDIKPSNVLLDLELRPWITDFGLAKSAGGDDLTTSGELLGTLRYLPPERLRGEYDVRGDVYGLGTTLYELTTLQPPFPDSEPAQLIRDLSEQEPVAPSTLRPEIPRDLETVIVKALAKDARDRYASPAALAADLGNFVEGRPIAARRASQIEATVRWCRRNPSLALLAGAVAALLLAITVGSSLASIWLRQKSELAIRAQHNAERAEQARRLELFRAHLARAREAVGTLSSGQRSAGLQAIRDAASTLPAHSLTSQRRQELIDAAIACLARSDIREVGRWPNRPTRLEHAAVDASLQMLAYPTDDERGKFVERIFFPATRRELRAPAPAPLPIEPLRGASYCLFSAGGRWLCELLRLDRPLPMAKIRIWDVHTGNLVLDFQPPPGAYVVTFHPDERHLLIADEDGALRLLSIENGRFVSESTPRFGQTPHITYSSDGKRLAVVPLVARAQIVDAATFETQTVLPQIGQVWSGAWHPHEPVLVIGNADGRLYRWNAETARGEFLPGGHPGRIVQVQCSTDGHWLLSCGDEMSQLRRWDGGELLLNIPGGDAAGPREGRITTSSEGQICIHDLVESASYRRIMTPARAAVFSPDGRWLVVSGDLGVQLYGARDGKLVADLDLDRCGPVTFRADGGEMITFGMFSHAWKWRLPTHDSGSIGPPMPVVAGAFFPSDAAELQPQYKGRHAVYTPAHDSAMVLVDHRNGWIVIGDDQGHTRNFAPLPGAIHVEISSDGRWIAGSAYLDMLSQGYSRVWNAANEELVLDLPHHTSAVFSPDGSWLAAASEKGLVIYGVDSWRLVRRVECPEGRSRLGSQIAFQPGGRMLALSDPVRAVRLIELKSGRIVATLPHAEPGYASWLSFSPDGHRLAVTRDKLDVSIWDLAALEQELLDLGLQSADLSPDGPAIEPSRPLSVHIDRGPLPSGSQWYKYWRTLALHEAEDKQWFDAIDNASNALAAANAETANIRAELLALRAQLHLRNHQPQQACDDWQDAVELDPQASAAIRSLAQIRLLGPEKSRDARRGHALAIRLLAIDGTDPGGHALLGIAHARDGRFSEARESLERVATGSEWEIVATYGLAWCEHALGNPDAATGALAHVERIYSQRAMALDDDLLADVERLRAEVRATLACHR